MHYCGSDVVRYDDLEFVILNPGSEGLGEASFLDVASVRSNIPLNNVCALIASPVAALTARLQYSIDKGPADLVVFGDHRGLPFTFKSRT